MGISDSARTRMTHAPHCGPSDPGTAKHPTYDARQTDHKDIQVVPSPLLQSMLLFVQNSPVSTQNERLNPNLIHVKSKFNLGHANSAKKINHIRQVTKLSLNLNANLFGVSAGQYTRYGDSNYF